MDAIKELQSEFGERNTLTLAETALRNLVPEMVDDEEYAAELLEVKKKIDELAAQVFKEFEDASKNPK